MRWLAETAYEDEKLCQSRPGGSAWQSTRQATLGALAVLTKNISIVVVVQDSSEIQSETKDRKIFSTQTEEPRWGLVRSHGALCKTCEEPRYTTRRRTDL
ncbi:hypothetical protein E2C01_089593 [Portunus trituberculatus]|uniref:Uncharacterized protein n=1 Tax=Portunus trituberculatus TaxID=210409 RepID=A0A5B7JIN8_PORTR|nr:hypothetical protein [Portunus trituberculatus]